MRSVDDFPASNCVSTADKMHRRLTPRLAQLIHMAEAEVVDKGGQTVKPQYLVIGSFGRKEKDSQHLGHVPDVLLKNTGRESAASSHLRAATRTESQACLGSVKSRVRWVHSGAVDVFIVKQRPVVLPPKPEPVVWVVGTDNSSHAKHALDSTLAMMGEGDTLYVYCKAHNRSLYRSYSILWPQSLRCLRSRGEIRVVCQASGGFTKGDLGGGRQKRHFRI